MIYSPAHILCVALGKRIGYSDDVYGGLVAKVDKTPANPTNVITLINTTPAIVGRVQRTGRFVTRPGVMVKVRHTDPVEGWNRISAIMASLESLYLELVQIEDEAYTIESCALVSGPFALGQSPVNAASEFTLNLTFTMRKDP
jgi:hypothetical protein